MSNFQPLEVVDRYRDPQPQVVENLNKFNQQVNCILLLLPVDGFWGVWGSWEACNATCGSSVRIRERNCSAPAPSNNGSDCVGNNSDTEICQVPHCPGKAEFHAIIGFCAAIKSNKMTSVSSLWL